MWHWVDLEPAAKEVARVLRPGGVLGLLWNLRDERVAWMAELGAIFGGDDHHIGRGRVILPKRAPFTDLSSAEFTFSQELATDDLVGFVASRSNVQVLEDEERASLLERVAVFSRTHPDLAGRSTIEVPYVTSCWRATRT
jgi:SAM-dependent methyltransferase